MATRSNIGYTLPDGNVRYIYCHWDGYPENNGNILQEHYQAAYKIAQLIELGDLSSLGAEIGVKHNFDERVDAQTLAETRCTFYGRDRGEQNVEPQTGTADDMLENDYAYLWNGTEWMIKSQRNNDFVPLVQVI